MAQTNRKTILIIDDQDIARKTLRQMLEYYEFEVLEGTNAREGLEILNRDKAKIGLVLLDTGLPGISGEKMLLALRSVDPTVQVAPCTDQSVAETKGRDDYQDVVGVLKKPIRTDRLLAVVRKAMGI